MNIGILRESKRDENRVALRPGQAHELSKLGHHVLFEKEAGRNSGYADAQYEEAEAIIVEKPELLERCELILKIKRPLESEYRDFDERHSVFSYLHLDENIPAENVRKLLARKLTGFAYEWLEVDGRYPLLEPMSRLTGYLVAQKTMELCTRYKGIICGGHEKGMPGARVLIIGLGTIGMAACKYFSDIHAGISVVDKQPDTVISRIENRFPGDAGMRDYAATLLNIIPFDANDIDQTLANVAAQVSCSDIVINCAVRREDLPKEKMRYLITESMVESMEPNSVLCDATGSDRDMVETCVSSASLYEFSLIHNVIHYNCDHVPSYVGRMATDTLTTATFPWVLKLANEGILNAVRKHDALRKALVCCKGHLTHQFTSTRKGLPYVDSNTLIGTGV